MPDDSQEARKAAALTRVRETHGRLERALAALTDEQIESGALAGGWSVKATLAHVTWWEQVALNALRGEPDEDILQGEEWNTDRANAKLFERNRERPLADVLAAFHGAYAELLRELEATPAARLDEAGPYGEPLHELIASNTDRHYDEHGAAIAAAFGLKTSD